MLAMGPYPRFLKDRVSGLFGHLSNRQALDLLKKLDLSYLQRLLLGHISDKNNDTNIISELLSTADLGGTAITFADQDVGSDWQELG
jgi:phosphoribosyl 1,2-cyclic phosphodiesterase